MSTPSFIGNSGITGITVFFPCRDNAECGTSFRIGDVVRSTSASKYFAISAIREVGLAYNIYVKPLENEGYERRIQLNIEELRELAGPELVLFTIKTPNALIEHMVE